MINVLKYMQKNYSSKPHPCMALVVDVLETEFHVNTEVDAETGYTLRERVALVLNVLSSKCIPVTEAKPGDVILMDAGGYHVGVAISKTDMLHVPEESMGVVCERMDSVMVRNRIVGIYRPQVTTNGHGN